MRRKHKRIEMANKGNALDRVAARELLAAITNLSNPDKPGPAQTLRDLTTELANRWGAKIKTGRTA